MSIFLSSCKFSCDLEDMDKPAEDSTSASGQNQIQNQSIEKSKTVIAVEKSAVDSALTDAIILQWFFKEVGKTEFYVPVTEVYLVVGGSEQNLIVKENMVFSETPRELYSEYQIPGDAITACRGWWAGGGNDYWVVPENGELKVYTRWIEEGSGPDSPAEVGKPELITKIKM